jgi:hypothetical protein
MVSPELSLGDWFKDPANASDDSPDGPEWAGCTKYWMTADWQEEISGEATVMTGGLGGLWVVLD